MGARVQLTKQTREALNAVHAAMMAGKLPAPPELKPNLTEQSITGTTNWFGDILSESNSKLIHQLAYGTAGTRTWGEYEKLLRTDEAVSKGVEFSKAQIRDARLSIEEPSEEAMEDRALAKRITDFVRKNLLEWLPMQEVAQRQTEGLLIPGFVLHETVFEQCSSPLLPGGTGYKLAKLSEMLPISIHPTNGWDERDGELAGVRQLGQQRDGKSFHENYVPADSLLLATWNKTGNNYLGFSPYRPVWYQCKIREQLLSLVGISQIRESAGIPIAEVEKGVKLTKSQQKKLYKLLANMVPHENAAAVMPAGVTLKWLFSPGANKGHVIDAWEKLGISILGQVQAQQMALGMGETGSRSVGEVHDKSADAFALGIIATLESVWNGTGDGYAGRKYTGVVRRLVDVNFGPQEAYPRVKWTLKQAKLKPVEYATAVKTLRDAGVITVHTIEDENAARERVGDRTVTEEEFEEAKAEAAEKAAKMAEALAQKSETEPPKPGQSSGTPKPKPGEKDETKPPKVARHRVASSSPSWQPRRPLRASELKLDLGSMAGFFDSERECFERNVRPMVVEMLTRCVPDVRAAMKDGEVEHEEIATLPLDMSRIDAFIGQFLKRARAEGWRQLAAEARRDARRTRTAAEEDDTFPPPDATPPAPNPETEKLLEAQRKRLARQMEARLRAALEETAIDVVRTGGSPEEVVADVVSDQVRTSALKGDAGGVLTKAFNMGRADFAEQYSDSVESVELSSILDEGTCGPCESMDGTELEFGSSEYERNTPPLRQCDGRNRCRCLYVFNFKGGGGFQPVDDE